VTLLFRLRSPAVLRAAAVGLAALLFPLSCGRSPERSAAGPSAESASAPSRAAAVEAEDVATRTASPAGADRVIWLGLDGLDWDHLASLARAGKMPNWSRLSEEGYRARLTAFEPMLSPLLWTTQETGVGPEVHRVLDFQERDPASGILGPVSERSRKIPALWNVLSSRGKKVGVVGFWATHPAEVVSGFFLSNRIDAATPAEVPRGVGSPTSLDATVRLVVGRDGQVPPEDLAGYWGGAPPAVASGAGYDDPVTALARSLGTTRVTQRLARELYDRERPDLLAVYFEGTDSIGHLFGRYAPPKLPCVSDAEFAALGHVAETYFAAVDRILGQWMRRAREDGAALVVTSDHGFRWGDDRPCEASGTQGATAAAWHRSPGVFLAWGRGIAAANATAPVTEFDVAPTLLALLGSPADRRMRGKVVPVLPALAAGVSKDLYGSISVETVPTEALDPKAASDYAKRLAALGYISPSGAAETGSAKASEAELTKGGWNNLGVYLRFSAGDARGAREAWLHAIAIDPSYRSPLANLARVDAERGDFRAATDWIVRSMSPGASGSEALVLSFAADFARRDRSAATELLRRAHAAAPANETLTREYALVLSRDGRCADAVRVAAPLEQSSNPASLNAAAAVAACLSDPGRVRALLSRSLAIDPNQPRVRDALESLPR
jgi:Flp pilus assembly protein TadD